MNKLCLLGAAALIATAFLPDVASAQRGGGGMRGGGGGGLHGGGMGGGFRGGGMGGGFRGGAIGGGFRGGARCCIAGALASPSRVGATWWEGRRSIKYERDAGFPYAESPRRCEPALHV